MSQETLLTNEDEARVYAMQLAVSPAFPMALLTAVDLSLFDILEAATDGGLTAAEVVARIPAIKSSDGSTDMIDRMLHLLAAYCVVTCSVRDAGDGVMVERVYGVAPAGRFFSKGGGDGDGSVATMLQLNAGRVVMESWYQLKETTIEGGKTTPFEKAHGISTFEYANSNSGFNKLYNKAMEGFTKLSMKKLLETYDGFKGVHVLVDVGGGTGGFLNLVLSKYPSIKGINFDMPHVIDTALSCPGIEHVGGDMFKKISNGDAILIKGVLHNWDDEHCVKILKKCHEAVTQTGKVIIVDFVLPTGADTTNHSKCVLQGDLYMLAMVNGKERTLPTFKSISSAAGFKFCELISSANAFSIIELLK